MKILLTTESNAIHNWMVKHVMGGTEEKEQYEVSEQALRMLLCVCDEVIKASKLVQATIIDKHEFVDGHRVPHFKDVVIIRDASKAKQLLPMGERVHSMRYDARYLHEIQGMRAHVDHILRRADLKNRPVVYANIPEV